MKRPVPEKPGPGQESVWDYPRPPLVEKSSREIVIRFGGEEICRSTNTVRVLETSHPPVYYIPPEDFKAGVLRPAEGRTFCEWKGVAQYFDVVAGGQTAPRAAWAYPDPSPSAMLLKEHIAVYPRMMEACFVDGEEVTPQPGGFYGGWITSHVAGPFKGEPGTEFW